MADNEVNAKLNADTEEAVDNVEELGDSFDEAADKAGDAADEIEGFGARLSQMGDKLTGVGTALSVGVTAPIVGVAGAAIAAGLDAVEAESLFETSFGNMAEAARQWSMETSDALGLNEFELRRQSATIFTMVESMGLGRDAAFDMATGISELSGDMASFFNLKPEEAFDKLRAGITGEAEPLKQLGILISDNVIKQTDFAKAILATGRELTEQEKVQARYIAIMQQTATAQGDLARTAESPANRLRAMSESIDEATTKLGLALIPAVEAVLPLFEKAVSFIEAVVQKFSELDPALQTAIVAFAGILAAIGPVLVVVGQVVGALGTLSTAWGATALAGTGFLGVMSAIGGFITGTLLPLLGALAVGIALGGAVGIAISEFLEWLGVIESTEEKTRQLLETMEPSQQQVRAMADASVIAGREITDWNEATQILNDNIQKMRDGSADAVDVVGRQAAATEEAAAAAAEAAAQEEAAAKATAAAAQAAKQAEQARKAEAAATKALADQLGTAGLVGNMEKTSRALDELNRRGERLSSAGLDRVIKQVQTLKKEQIPLTGALKEWDDRVKAAAANLPSLSSALADVPAPELSDDINQLAGDIDFATDGLDPFTDAWFEATEKMTDAERAALGMPPAIKENTNAAELMSVAFQDMANILDVFGISADSAIGQVVGLSGSLIAAAPAMTNFKNSILGNQDLSAMERFQGVASGVASGIAGVASATSQGGAGRSALGGALAGAQAGAQIGGPIGAGVGAAAGAIVGFFRGRGRDRIRKAVSDAVGADVSEDLSQTIKDAAEEAGRTLEEQSLFQLGDIFRDVGVDEFREGAMGAANAVTDLMQSVADGSIDAEEGIGAIGDAFGELVNQTFEAGRVADAGIIQLVRNARELGQEVPEIAAFVEQALGEAAQGISKVIGGIQIADPQDAQDQATIFASAFFATMEEVGLLEAVDAFGPAFDELKSQLSDLGIEGVNFGGVERLFQIAGQEEFRPLLEGVQGLDEALVGMANSGFLTADSFSAFQSQGEAAFEQLQAAGLNQNEALQQMAPFLQSAIDAAERFGIPLDANTQSMIQQAEAAGIAFETDPMNRMADAMVLVAELLGATEDQLASLGNTAATTGEQMSTSLTGAATEGSAAFAGMTTVAQEAGAQVSESLAGGFEEARQSIQDVQEDGLLSGILDADQMEADLGRIQEAVRNFDLETLREATEDGFFGSLAEDALEQLPLVQEQLNNLTGGAEEGTMRVGENIAALPGVAEESIGGVQEAFTTGSEEITNGLDPIAEKMATEILDAGAQTSQAIDASFRSTNDAIKSGLGEVSSTFVGQVAPAALQAAAATDRIADAAREAARAAASIEFPDGGGGGADVSAAAGFRGVLGRDTLIQAHRGEFVNIIPENQTRRMDFASAQNGMGPGLNGDRNGNINMGDTTLVFQASGNRRTDDQTIDRLIKELSAEDGRKRSQLQRMLGVRT